MAHCGKPLPSSNYIFECRYCYKIFNSKNGLQNHTDAVHFINNDCAANKSFITRSSHKPKHEISNYECKLCFKLFNSEIARINHNSAVHPSNITALDKVLKNSKAPFTCSKCVHKFKNQFDLKQHLLAKPDHIVDSSAKINTYLPTKRAKIALKCNYCFQFFQTTEQLENHQDLKHKNIDYFICNYCPKRVLTRKGKISHTRSAHGIDLIDCTYCEELFETFKDLIQHNNYAHSQSGLNIGVSKNQEKKITSYWTKQDGTDLQACNYCFLTFNHQKDLNIHKQSKHKDIDFFPCQICPLVFSSEYFRNNHTSDVHKKISCDYCSKNFANSADLQQHFESKHKNADYFPCDHCSKCFSSEKAKSIHFNTSHIYTCSYCFKKFNEHTHLTEHENQEHRNVDFFPCDYCSKIFSSEMIKNNHVEENHVNKCNLCFEKFNTILDLQKHNNKHENVVTFPFKWKENLPVVAAANFASVEIHKCNFCNKDFSEEQFLKQHEQSTHKNIDYFPCEHCPDIFSSNINRRKHFLEKHRDVKNYVINPFSLLRN